MQVEIEKDDLDRVNRHTSNAKWLMRRYDEYRKEYGGRYVAVYNKKIIDHSDDLIKLKKRIKDKPVFIQYIYKEKPRLIL